MISATSKLTDHPRYMIGLLALTVGLAFPYRFDDYFGSNSDFFIFTEVSALVFLWVFADRKGVVRQIFWVALVLGSVGASSVYLGNNPLPLRFVAMNFMKFLLLCATFATMVRLLRDPDWSDRFMMWVVIPASTLIVSTIFLDHGPFEAQFRFWKLYLNSPSYTEQLVLEIDPRGLSWQPGSGILDKNFLAPGWSVIAIAGGLWLTTRRRGSQLGLILIIVGLGAALGAPKRASLVVVAIFMFLNFFPVVKLMAFTGTKGIMPLVLIGLLAVVPFLGFSGDDVISYFRAPLRIGQYGTGFGFGSEEVDGRINVGLVLPAQAVAEDLGYATFGRGFQFSTLEIGKTHSTLFSILIAFGIIGSLAFIPWITQLTRIMLSRHARNSIPWAWRVGVGLIVTATAHGLIDGFLGPFLTFPAWTYFFWLALGVGLVLRSWDHHPIDEQSLDLAKHESPA